MILGIDLTSKGSGGAYRHITEILRHAPIDNQDIQIFFVIGNTTILSKIPNSDNIIKYTNKYINGNFISILFWKLFYRDKFYKNSFNILYIPYGNYIGSFRPFVTMSRNILIFDKSQQRILGFSFLRIKMILLKFLQTIMFNNSNGIIFISKHAKNLINPYLKNRYKSVIIHHGVSNDFNFNLREQNNINFYTNINRYKILYVSTILPYKYQWNLVYAIYNLRLKGYNLELNIVGDALDRKSTKLLNEAINKTNLNGNFVNVYNSVSMDEINRFYMNNDLFVFNSTCENMPNILIEAMSSGMPIICSKFPPMPEFLKNGGVYINPTSIKDIENNLLQVILDQNLRNTISTISKNYSKKYTWNNCAIDTFSFIKKTFIEHERQFH